MTWRVARSLDTLLAEINEAAPNRSKASDGSIGDAAHASRDSDHNPFVILNGVGIVRARDFTHDPDGGLDCNDLATALAALIASGVHPSCRHGAYVIWQRRIFSFDRRNEGWRPYGGSNPHDHHCHLSVSLDPAGFDSTAPWGVMEDDDMTPQQAKQLDGIATAVSSLADMVEALADGNEAIKRRITKAKREIVEAIKADE